MPELDSELEPQPESVRITLASIGDGVILADALGRVTFLNPVAETLTGWLIAEAHGKSLKDVFRIVDEQTGRSLDSSIYRAERQEGAEASAALLIARDSSQRAIDATVSPIRQTDGTTSGLILTFRDVTEKRRSQRDRNRLAAIVESSDDAIVGYSLDGVITAWNAGAQRLLGYQDEEVLGKSIFAIAVPSERGEELRQILDRISRGERVETVESVRVDKAGRRFDASIGFSAIRDTRGKIAGASEISRDISQRKKVEQRLHENQERFRLALEAGRMGSWEWNVRTNEVIWSESLEAIHGLSPGSFPGTFAAFQRDIHEDDLPRVLRSIQEAMENRHEYRIEYRLVAPDGRLHWVEARGKPMPASHGQPDRMVGVCMDITDRKRLEDELHRRVAEIGEAEAALRFLAEASKSLAALVDSKSTLQKVAQLGVPNFADWCALDFLESDAMHRVAVASADPTATDVNRDFNRIFNLSPQSQFGPARVLRTGRAEMGPENRSQETSSAPNVEPAAAHRSPAYLCVPLTTKHRTVGVLTFAFAEPGRRFTPADLAVAEGLAHRAVVSIENARLYEELREADLRKDEFLAMLAHELRNPLAPIRSGLDLLTLDKAVDEETVELMKHQVENLVRLVDDLLDMSRILQGKVRLRRESVELSQVVRRAVETVNFLVQRRHQELVTSIPDEPLFVFADPIRVTQVLGNLLNNASKFTVEGGRLELTAHREANTLVIRVRDNGMGINRHMLTKVFDLFTQGASAIDRSEGGLGIGLTLVKSLVEMHGGTVAAASEGLGKGSVFTVTLPLIEQAHRTERVHAPPRAVRERRILVVDDNVGAAKMLSLLLSRLGPNEVRTAHDGNSTLAIASSFRPDIVFLDIGLPVMNGFEIARRMRANREFDSTLLVAVTGYGQEEDRRKSREAGFDEHLVKPVDVTSLRLMFDHPKLVGNAGE